MPKSKVVKAYRAKFPRLEFVIKTYGLNQEQLVVMLDLIFSRKLGELLVVLLFFIKMLLLSNDHFIGDVLTQRLIQLLLPRERVSEKHVLRIFSHLSCRDYSTRVMVSMLS